MKQEAKEKISSSNQGGSRDKFPRPLRERVRERGQKCAFTLAEVLITLGIIGTVAAITMPVINQKIREMQTVNRLKQSYSILSQAYERAVQDYGTPDNWDLANSEDKTSSDKLMEKFQPYLKTTKICKSSETGCLKNVNYVGLDGKQNAGNLDSNNNSKARLANGTIIMPWVWDANCSLTEGTSIQMKNVCGNIMVDVNGTKEPNQYGVDTFFIYITKYGLVPHGVAADTSGYSFKINCKDKSIGYVSGWSTNGMGCAGWVIYNGNMDYLHCNDLSWTGKKKCR